SAEIPVQATIVCVRASKRSIRSARLKLRKSRLYRSSETRMVCLLVRKSPRTLATRSDMIDARRGSVFKAIDAHADSNRGFTALSSPLLPMHVNVPVLEQFIGAYPKTLIESASGTYGKARVLRERLKPTGPAFLGVPAVLQSSQPSYEAAAA